MQLTNIKKLANSQDLGNLETIQINKPFFVISKTGINKITPVPITTMEKGRFIRVMHFYCNNKPFVRLSGIVKMLDIK